MPKIPVVVLRSEGDEMPKIPVVVLRSEGDEMPKIAILKTPRKNRGVLLCDSPEECICFDDYGCNIVGVSSGVPALYGMICRKGECFMEAV